MSGVDVRTWLESRRPPPPEPLRVRLLDAVAGAGAVDDLPTTLAELGTERLRAVLAASGDRRAAYDLLVADALLTYACEAAFEAGPDAVEAFTRAWGPERFAALLPPA